jgi:hypothetical protein
VLANAEIGRTPRRERGRGGARGTPLTLPAAILRVIQPKRIAKKSVWSEMSDVARSAPGDERASR